jgi:uncharacterized protein YndB with AHSA1/START domain
MFKWLFGSKDAGPAVSGTKETIVIQRRINAPPDRAFAVFVDEFSGWWPRDLTWGKDNLTGITIEPKYNGRCVERTKDGATAIWGTVLSVNRPDHIVIAWQVGPGRKPIDHESAASRVDVRFVAVEGGTTDVVIVHRDFARHGDGWESFKAEMAAKSGWPQLIDLYAKAVGR